MHSVVQNNFSELRKIFIRFFTPSFCEKSDKTKKAVIEWLKSKDYRPTTRNPYFFLLDFREPRTQTLTFKEYYARFGTTLEQDGWRMTNPTGQQVIYVKN